MEIEVWSVGKAKFTADPEFQEPVIREVIDQRGDVADVIIDYTDSERSDISHDEYARVTGDIPGLVLFEGWLTGDRNAPPPATLERESAAFNEAPRGSAEITITARSEGHGLLVSLRTAGDFSGEMVDRRFYSIDQAPPSGLEPADFWAPILGHIARFLASGDPDDFVQDRHADLDPGENGGAMSDAEFYDRTAGADGSWDERDDVDRRANGESDDDAGDDL